MSDNVNISLMPSTVEDLSEIFNQIFTLIKHDETDAAANLLLNLHQADVADFIDYAGVEACNNLLNLILPKLHPETLNSVSDINKQKLVEVLGIEPAANLVSKLDVEDAIDVVSALNKNDRQELLSYLDVKFRYQILENFSYEEDSVGRILEHDFIILKDHWTVKRGLQYLRDREISHDFYAVIIVDAYTKPVGTLMLSNLLTNADDELLSNVMTKNIKIIDVNTKIDDLAFMFKQYDLTIAPVVGKNGKLLGTISIGNMLYVMDEQSEHEFMNFGGINVNDIFNDLFSTVKHRLPWLFINLLVACFSALIIEQFNETMVRMISIAIIMPIVASMGGNAGTQAMTITVRAIANREILAANTPKIVLKEIFVSLINGIILALMSSALSYIFFKDIGLSFVFGVAVVANFILAGFFGTVIPIILHHFSADPATSSGVLLTALTDTLGFFIFLGLATWLLI